MIEQILSAFVGSVGFALFFNMKGKQLAAAGIGGALTWIFVGLFAEIMARVGKAPATIFLTTAAVPLIPGGGLYYTMLGIVEKNEEVMLTNANNTITIALAIALGFIITAIVSKYWVYIKNRRAGC